MRKLLHYRTHIHSAPAEWVVCIHGAGGSIHTWKRQVEDLKCHFNLLLIDLRDHGDSKDIKPEHSTYNFDIIVQDVIEVLDHIAIAKAHFVTLSFGSVVMQAICKRQPQYVEKMICIGGIFDANWMIQTFVRLAKFLNLLLPYAAMYKTFSWLLMPRKNHQLARRVYQIQARKLQAHEYIKWLGLYDEFFSLLNQFNSQAVEQPMLVLMGSEDYLFLPSARRFAATHHRVSLQLVKEAGHICNIEKPKETNERIMRFLHTGTS